MLLVAHGEQVPVAEAASRGHVVVRPGGEKLRTGRTVEGIAGQGRTACDTVTAQPGASV